jgi:hypothetical protein
MGVKQANRLGRCSRKCGPFAIVTPTIDRTPDPTEFAAKRYAGMLEIEARRAAGRRGNHA